MKKIFFNVLALTFMLLQGCKRGPEAPKISEWERYQDPYFKATFSYPKGWHVITEGTKASVYSSPDAVQKFFDPLSKTGELGAQLVVAFEKLDTMRSAENYVTNYKNDLTNSGFVVKSIESKSLADLPGSLVTYSGRFDERTKLDAKRLIAIRDSMVYYISLAAFNDLLTPYHFVFDTLLASIQIPKPKAPEVAVDPSIPSSEFEKFENNMLMITHPANFEPTFPQPKGEIQYSMEIKGYRQDSNIRIDVLPAKGLTVEKVLEQNVKKYPKVSSRGETTIDKAKALYLNCSLAPGVDTRVYFFVKSDKVYRVIMNYFQPKKKDFLPAFEKSVASLHIKQ